MVEGAALGSTQVGRIESPMGDVARGKTRDTSLAILCRCKYI